MQLAASERRLLLEKKPCKSRSESGAHQACRTPESAGLFDVEPIGDGRSRKLSCIFMCLPLMFFPRLRGL
jgi:hypothetical protein